VSAGPAPALAAVERVIASFGSACVAFSGGVDSSVVLAIAARALGAEQVTAFTAASETYREEELERARTVAAELGVRHVVRRTGELDDECFAANPPRRCYHCKAHLLDGLAAAAAEDRRAVLVDGANRDDLGDFRPGMQAADERGVRHPLVEAGLGKQQVRALAAALGLPTADLPAQACLASRIPYGERITVAKLRQVAAAEDALGQLGFGPCRVRHHGAIARVELPLEQLTCAVGEARAVIVERLRDLGWTYVTLDLGGLRSGSMNEVLTARVAGRPRGDEAAARGRRRAQHRRQPGM